MRRALVLVPLLLASACSGGGEEPSEAPTAAAQASVLQPALEAVEAELDVARASLSAALDALVEATGASDLTSARAAAERAVHALSRAEVVATDLDGDGTTADPGVTPFLPAGDDQDALSGAVAAARVAGGPASHVLAVLDDPVAGDVTVWQRRPEEHLEHVLAAVDAGTDEAVAGLDGEVPRALAWALLAARAEDADEARGYAERAAAHLSVALAALDGVRTPSPAPSPTPSS